MTADLDTLRGSLGRNQDNRSHAPLHAEDEDDYYDDEDEDDDDLPARA